MGWGGYRRGRNRKVEEAERLIADIRPENKERLRILAGDRNEPINECVDGMIEFVWRRRERKLAAVPDGEQV